MLQRVAVCCSGCHRHPEHLVDKKVGEYYRALAYSEHGKQAIVWRVVPCFLQKECAGKRRCVAVCCSVLQCVAVCCSVFKKSVLEREEQKEACAWGSYGE